MGYQDGVYAATTLVDSSFVSGPIVDCVVAAARKLAGSPAVSGPAKIVYVTLR